jgi:hypothetical protein
MKIVVETLLLEVVGEIIKTLAWEKYCGLPPHLVAASESKRMAS